MLEDLTVLSVDEIRDYILEMWKYFYEEEKWFVAVENSLLSSLINHNIVLY